MWIDIDMILSVDPVTLQPTTKTVCISTDSIDCYENTTETIACLKVNTSSFYGTFTTNTYTRESLRDFLNKLEKDEIFEDEDE